MNLIFIEIESVGNIPSFVCEAEKIVEVFQQFEPTITKEDVGDLLLNSDDIDRIAGYDITCHQFDTNDTYFSYVSPEKKLKSAVESYFYYIDTLEHGYFCTYDDAYTILKSITGVKKVKYKDFYDILTLPMFADITDDIEEIVNSGEDGGGYITVGKGNDELHIFITPVVNCINIE